MFISQRVLYGVIRQQGENVVTLPHSAQSKHEFWREIKHFPKSKKISPRKEVALELLHHRLGHISTRSLMDGDTENLWKDIDPKIDPYPLFKSCQISSMNKKDISKNPLKPKAPLKWVLWTLFQKCHQNV